MDAQGAGSVATMPPKKKKSKAGRPKEDEPVRALASLKGTDAMEAWFDGLVEAGEMASRSHALKRAVKLLAADIGYTEPMPKR